MQRPSFPAMQEFISFPILLPKMAFLLLLFIAFSAASGSEAFDFAFNGFQGSNVSSNGISTVTPHGLLVLTNASTQSIGHAFYPTPLQFKNITKGGGRRPISFSTTFVFTIVPRDPDLGGHGFAFVIAPSKDLQGAFASLYLGLLNLSNDCNSSNRVIAIEMDTVLSLEFGDINNNHVGININSMRSIMSAPAAYFTRNGINNISLISCEPIQVWIDYSGEEMELNVTLAPAGVPKPRIPLLRKTIDLLDFISESSYVGFSASTGAITSTHVLMGWSFKTNGHADELDLSNLPRFPIPKGYYQKKKKTIPKGLKIGLPVIAIVLLLSIAFGVIILLKKIKFREVLECWELKYGPHRFSYKDLYVAANGFKEKGLLGEGGFGRVYKGTLKASGTEVAVKRVSHESKQGVREFVSEIVSLGRLRHRNLVQLLGYCRRRGELLLVYDYMPNASLDKFLFDHPKSKLSWSQRFHIVKGVASGLLYLHEEWEQVVIHRDIKASNVLLDKELNGRLGDFGLARLYDHGSNPISTNIVGTMGYLPPELTRSGTFTTSTDVFSFGAFLLEVACGRRPIDRRLSPEKMVLLDWVWDCWMRGAILQATDPELGDDFVAGEVELVLKLGLICSHCTPAARPSMRQVIQFLELCECPLPETMNW